MLNIVVLIHRGRSSFDLIEKESEKLGINILLISSSTGDEVLDKKLLDNHHETYVSTNDTLSYEEVSDCVRKFISSGHRLIGCISIWEGYREIMAEINNVLKANDISAALVQLLRDKYQLRRELHELGVSDVYCDILNEEILERVKSSASEYFVKPRFGIASYGAFKITQDTTWESIQSLKSEILSDQAHSHCFGNLDFIVEDYLSGKEYSFEVISYQGKAHTVAIHEKVEMKSVTLTTLESAFILPPISLSYGEQAKATSWLKSIFEAIEIKTGCFHVEAKKTHCGWELIEINPRLGGSYIPDSVFLSSKVSLLSCWILSLNTEVGEETLLQALRNEEVHGGNKKKKGTFFRIYYGQPGGKIADVRFLPGVKPSLYEFFFTKGDVYPVKNCEIFLGHSLWSWDVNESKHSIEELIKDSESYLDITYE